MTPSHASVRALKARLKALCQQRTGRTPAQLIAPLNPVLRGWANSHRHVICGETFATRDNCVWPRLSRWASGRHPNTTGRGLAEHDVPHQAGNSWRFTAPVSGKAVSRVREAVTPRCHVQVKGDATPFDPAWAAYFQHRDRHLTRHASSPGRAYILRQHGLCPVCRQVIQCEEALERHHRDGHHQENRSVKLVFLHPNGHRQVHSAPGSNTGSPRS